MKALVILLALCSVAHAEEFDLKGWKLLGTRTIGSKGEAIIVLRNYDGNLDELRLTADGGAISIERVIVDHLNLDDIAYLKDFVIVDGGVGPSLSMTDNQDTLEHLQLTVVSVDDPVTLRVYGRDRRRPDVYVAPEHPLSVASEWTKLGKTTLDGTDLGRITLDDTTRWAALAFVAPDDLDLLALTFHTSEGEWIPYLTMKLRDGARVVPVSVAGHGTVSSIDFEYTVIGAPATRLTVYGLSTMPDVGTMSVEVAPVAVAASATWSEETVRVVETKSVAPPPAPRLPLATPTDDDGWTLLGEDDVDLIDDEIEIKKQKSTWSKLKIVAAGDDVDVTSIEVHPTGKKTKPVREDLEQTFTDGTARVIDLPGKRRAIKKVRLQYTKHRLDASTRVKVYAR